MKITIEGEVKEIAALAGEAQARREMAMFGDKNVEQLINGLGLLIDLKEKGLLQLEVVDKERADEISDAQSSEEQSDHSY